MKRFSIIMGILGCCFLFASCDDNHKHEADHASSTTVQEQMATLNVPNYLVATLSSFPPFIVRDKYGRPTGFDVDILNAIAQEEGFTVTFLPQPWHTILPSLENGSRDIAATGLVITPERRALYDFSDPYLDTGWLAVLRKPVAGQPQYKNFVDLRLAKGLVYVAQDGTAGERQLNSFLRSDEKKTLKKVDTQYQEIQALMNGEADVAFNTSRVLQYYMNSDRVKGQLYSIEQPNMTNDQLAFVVRKGRHDLREKINRGLKKIRENGTYNQIVEKWYGKQD